MIAPNRNGHLAHVLKLLSDRVITVPTDVASCQVEGSILMSAAQVRL